MVIDLAPMLVMPAPCPWRKRVPFDGIELLWLVATPLGKVITGSVAGAALYSAYAKARV